MTTLVRNFWAATEGKRHERIARGFWPKEGVCARCGLLLSEAPGRVTELCAICCEELARGVVYVEPRERAAKWMEAMR